MIDNTGRTQKESQALVTPGCRVKDVRQFQPVSTRIKARFTRSSRSILSICSIMNSSFVLTVVLLLASVLLVSAQRNFVVPRFRGGEYGLRCKSSRFPRRLKAHRRGRTSFSENFTTCSGDFQVSLGVFSSPLGISVST